MTGPLRILIVEDDPDQRSALAEILRLEGYVTREADSAEAGLKLLQADTFDLLVTDYDLGGATGRWLAQMASQSGHVSAPRALLVTGHDQVSDDDVLKVVRKPLDLNRFLSEVQQALTWQPPASVDAPHRIAFTLYVNESLPATRTLKNLQAFLKPYDSSQIALRIVDVSTVQFDEAEEYRVVATPTLVKTFPAPPVWIAGEFDDPSVISVLLDHAGVQKAPATSASTSSEPQATSEQAAEPESVAALARLIYDEMDIEPRRMHVAIEIAREHWQRIGQLLVERGHRRPHPPVLEGGGESRSES